MTVGPDLSLLLARSRFGARARPALAACALLLGGSALAACDRAPSDVREWTPADHDPPEQPAPPPGARASAAPAEDADQLAALAWQQTCATCHGPQGHGDGPQGPMVHAPDLSRPDWQSRVTDAEILATIKNGKNQMPGFSGLPASVLDALVKRVRSLKAP
jgi:cytochrome c oxidase cbb3-type subunit 3